jgi:hypothetical protein
MLSSDAQLMLLRFVDDLFRNMHESKIIAPLDRILLIEKLSQDVYAPLPIAGSVNIWGTYCSLSANTAKIFVIKTALDEVVQE